MNRWLVQIVQRTRDTIRVDITPGVTNDLTDGLISLLGLVGLAVIVWAFASSFVELLFE